MPGYGLGYSSLVNRSIFSSGPSVDPNAQAFITAAGITDPNQQSAINQLVVDLKGYGIWTKMKALYPFVGGTASTHKWNLKNPLDTDAAFRLVFSGGGTHSSTGWLPNGTNGFADTKLVPNTSLTFNNTHLSLYSRTNVVTNAWNGASNSYLPIFAMMLRSSDNPNLVYFDGYDYSAHRISATNTDSRGLFIASITSSTSQKIIKNGSVLVTNTTAQTQSALPSYSMYLGNRNDAGTITGPYDNKELAFASIGDGLNDTEAANFYTAVQTFQTTLGRSIGTQTVSDADAQAFVTAASITDQVQATAINNLVIGMKADGLWSKMKAVYPFVGGTASSHKYNLKNPLDTDAAFRLVFNGGVTHSSNGILPNGTNGYANTYYNPFNNLSDINSNHISIYSRTNVSGGIDMGGGAGAVLVDLETKYSGTSYNWNMASFHTHTNTDSTGHYINTRTASNAFKLIKNGSTTLGSSTGSAGATKPNNNYYIGVRNYDATYANREYAFASIGDGLNDTEAANFYTAVQAFQTTLGRNV